MSAGMRSSGPTREGSELTQRAVGGIWFLRATEQRLPEVLCHVSLPRAAHNPAAGSAQGKSKGGLFAPDLGQDIPPLLPHSMH